MNNLSTLQTSKDRKIWGVAGGIAEHFGIDAWIVRIVILVLALIVFDPFSIAILYGVLAFIMDRDESETMEVISVEQA